MKPCAVLVFILFFVSSRVLGQGGSPTQPSAREDFKVIDTDVDSYVSTVLTDWGVSGGTAIAIVRLDEEERWHTEMKGYGAAHFDGRPFTPDTFFPVASNSKLFAVLASGLLIYNASVDPPLKWSSKIASIIPEWDLQDDIAAKQATIRDLMSHRTGMPRHDFSFDPSSTVFKDIQQLRNLRPSADFRDHFQYNNAMYRVLSYIPSSILPDRPTYARYVKSRILEPLGLNGITYSTLLANKTGRLADAFTREVDVEVNPLDVGQPRPIPLVLPECGEDGSVNAGDAGMLMTLSDAVKWIQVLLLKGKNPSTGDQVIPRDLVDTAASEITIQSGANTEFGVSSALYGGGQASSNYRSHRKIEHGGYVTGYFSEILRCPDDNVGIVTFVNDDLYGFFIQEILKNYLLDRLLGLPFIDWNERYKALVPSLYPNTTSASDVSPTTNESTETNNFKALAGLYHDPGYGDIELCLVAPKRQEGTNVTIDVNPGLEAGVNSQHCRQLLAELEHRLPGILSLKKITFMAKWNKTMPYLLLSHKGGNSFGATLYSSFPTHNLFNASSEYYAYPTVRQSIILLDFQVKFTLTGHIPSDQINEEEGNGPPQDTHRAVGFGIFGISGAKGEIARDGTTVEESADVWFERAN